MNASDQTSAAPGSGASDLDAPGLDGKDPSTGGILKALVSLATPLKEPQVEPTHVAEPFARVQGRFGRDRDLRMDVYLPEAPTGASCVLVHGGGFVLGHRGMKPMRVVATRLVNHGIAVASLEYRLLQHGGTLAAASGDVVAGIAAFRERAPTLGLDPERVTVAGFSAGSALTMLAVARREVELAGVVSVYGPTDFSRVTGLRARQLSRWITDARHPELIQARSPVAHAGFDLPLLMIHGDADALVAHSHSQRLAEHRDERSLPTKLVTLEGAPHSFFTYEGSHWIDHAIDEMVRFVSDPASVHHP